MKRIKDSFPMVVLLAFMVIPMAAGAQVLPNFPYSALGVGEFDYNPQGMLSGMGYGVSALRSNNYLNNSNPASYSALQDKLVLVELSGTGRSATLSNETASAKSSDFEFSRLVFGFKLNKFWGTSFGLVPMSSVNYQIATPNNVIGSSQAVNSIYQGNGGLHEFYWGNGFRIGKHLSVGGQVNYIFGAINQIEEVGYDVSNPILTATQQTFLQNLNFSYGLQYFTKINKTLDMSMGLQYQSQRALRASYTLNIVSGSDTLTSQVLQNNYFTIPAQYRGGIAFTYANKLTVDFDYIFENWSALSIKNNNVKLVNSSSYGFGLQWIPGGNTVSYQNGLLQRLMVEGGLNYTKSYLDISQKQITDANLSIGGGLYNKGRNLSCSLGLEFGSKGAYGSGIVNENYTNLYLTVVIRDIWFVRKKYF